MKVIHKNIPEIIRGGAIPMFHHVKNLGLDKLIDNVLGERITQAYTHSEVLLGWSFTIITEGFRFVRAEAARKTIGLIKGLVIPSHDTCGRRLKELSTPSIKFTPVNKKHPERAKPYMKCENRVMNDLLIKTGIEAGLLKQHEPLVMDLDATYIHSNTKEATYSYKVGQAYSPVGCFVDKSPVYIEMRSGNASPQSEITPILKRTLELLDENNIEICKVRMDGASYNTEVTSFLDQRGIEFLIGAQLSERAYKMLKYEAIWKTGVYENSSRKIYNAQYAAIPFNINQDKNKYRYVVVREKDNAARISDTTWDLHDGYYYKAILTNDWKTPESVLIKEYDKRGGFERNFDYMKNDFGWRIPPFSKLNENLTYLIHGGITSNIYQGFIKYASSILTDLKSNIRLETFLREFLSVTCHIIGDEYQFNNTEIHFEKLM